MIEHFVVSNADEHIYTLTVSQTNTVMLMNGFNCTENNGLFVVEKTAL